MKRKEIIGPERPQIKRRDFVKIAGRGLVAGLALFATSNFITPTIANSQGSEMKEIAGQKVNVVRLDESLEKLNEKTKKYRGGEYFPTKANSKYSIDATVPKEVTFLVTFDTSSNKKDLVVSVHNTTTPHLKKMEGFAKLVKDATGQDLTRVKFVLETGTYVEDGKTERYTNAYIFPVNKQGEITSNIGNGEYLIYGSSQYGDTVVGDPVILVDTRKDSRVAKL